MPLLPQGSPGFPGGLLTAAGDGVGVLGPAGTRREPRLGGTTEVDSGIPLHGAPTGASRAYPGADPAVLESLRHLAAGREAPARTVERTLRLVIRV